MMDPPCATRKLAETGNKAPLPGPASEIPATVLTTVQPSKTKMTDTTWLNSDLPDLSSTISTILPTNEQVQHNDVDGDIDADLQLGLLVDGHEDLLSDDTMLKINALLTPEQQQLLEQGSTNSCFDPMFASFPGQQLSGQSISAQPCQDGDISSTKLENVAPEKTENGAIDSPRKSALKPETNIVRRSPRQSSRNAQQKLHQVLKPQAGRAKRTVNLDENPKTTTPVQETKTRNTESASSDASGSESASSRRRSSRLNHKSDDDTPSVATDRKKGRGRLKSTSKEETPAVTNKKLDKKAAVSREKGSNASDEVKSTNTKNKSPKNLKFAKSKRPSNENAKSTMKDNSSNHTRKIKSEDVKLSTNVKAGVKSGTAEVKPSARKTAGKRTLDTTEKTEVLPTEKEESNVADEDEDDGEEDEEDEEDDDSDFDPENDPDKLWCICKRPHGNRFMIMCDKCEEWFHGECVGISMTMGRDMEKTGEEWTCSKCQAKLKSEKKAAKGKRIVEREAAREMLKSRQLHNLPSNSTDDESEDDVESPSKKLRKGSSEGVLSSTTDDHDTGHKGHKKVPMPELSLFADPEHVKSRHDAAHRRLSSEHVKSAHPDTPRPVPGRRNTTEGRVQRFYSDGSKGDRAEEMEEFPKKPQSSEPRFVIPKRAKTTPTPKSHNHHRMLVPPRECAYSGCKKFALKNAIYCSPACISRHAEESLQFIENEKKRRTQASSQDVDNHGNGSSKVSSSADGRSHLPSADRIAVVEKSSGKVVAGVMAPTKARLVSWLEDHPTFEILLPAVKSDPSQRKDKKEQDDIVRKNVKRSLKEILLSRCREIDHEIEVDKVTKLASAVEEEMLKAFDDTGQKYKTKYRSLMFNLKDRKNKILFLRLVQGDISPQEIVHLTPEQLASSELMRWRERETKHNIEMIKKHEEEEAVLSKPTVKKTHKGEVEIDNDENLTNLDVKVEESDTKPVAGAETAASETGTPLLLEDSTDQHSNHLFDLNCKICTGKQAPPGEPQTTTTGGHVTTTVIQAIPESSVPSPTQDSGINQSLSPSAVDSFTVSTSTKQLPTSVQKKETADWKGFLMMQSVAKFATCAFRVSGPCENMLQTLPDTVHICGRISPEQVWDYIFQLKTSHNKEINVFRFEMASEEEKAGYIALYNYFYTRRRIGVVANCYSTVKDMYVLPLASHDPIPPELKPLDGPGFPIPRPHMLVGIMIKVKNSPPVGSKRPKAFSQRSPVQSVLSKAKPVQKSPQVEKGVSFEDIVFQNRSTSLKDNTVGSKKEQSVGDDSPHTPPENSPNAAGEKQKAIEQEQLRKLEEQNEQLKRLQQQVQEQMTVNQRVSDQLGTVSSSHESASVGSSLVTEKTPLGDTPYDPEDDFVIDLIEDIPIAKRPKKEEAPVAAPSEIMVPVSLTLTKSESKMPELPPIPIPGFPGIAMPLSSTDPRVTQRSPYRQTDMATSSETGLVLRDPVQQPHPAMAHEPVSPPDPNQRPFDYNAAFQPRAPVASSHAPSPYDRLPAKDDSHLSQHQYTRASPPYDHRPSRGSHAPRDAYASTGHVSDPRQLPYSGQDVPYSRPADPEPLRPTGEGRPWDHADASRFPERRGLPDAIPSAYHGDYRPASSSPHHDDSGFPAGQREPWRGEALVSSPPIRRYDNAGSDVGRRPMDYRAHLPMPDRDQPHGPIQGDRLPPGHPQEHRPPPERPIPGNHSPFSAEQEPMAGRYRGGNYRPPDGDNYSYGRPPAQLRSANDAPFDKGHRDGDHWQQDSLHYRDRSPPRGPPGRFMPNRMHDDNRERPHSFNHDQGEPFDRPPMHPRGRPPFRPDRNDGIRPPFGRQFDGPPRGGPARRGQRYNRGR